jgi:hypothetical protein
VTRKTLPDEDVPPGTATFTCDWGRCDKESVMLRWSPSYPGWLSVCKSHMARARPERLRPLDDDPLWKDIAP